MEVRSLLAQFNLTEKQILIYLAALRLGSATVYELANASGLKRPTAYLIVDELLDEGLLSQSKSTSRRSYQALSPNQLLRRWQERVHRLAGALPALEALAIHHTQPNVKVFEGKDALRQVYSQLRPNIFKRQEILFYGSVATVMQHYPDELDFYLTIIKDKRARGRELLSRAPEDKTLAKKIRALHNPHYQVRFLPKELLVSNESAILGNKLFLFDLSQRATAVTIDSSAIAETQRALFELAWQQAQR